MTKDLINKVFILSGAKYFSSGILPNYVVSMPAKKYTEYFSGTTRIESWKSNGMLEENIEIWLNQTAIAPTSVDQYFLPDINFNGHCLIKNNISIPEKVISLYISYMLTPWLRNLNTDFTVKNYYLDL